MSQEYFTVREVAERFGKKPATVRQWIKDRRLQAIVINGRYLIPKDSLDSLEQTVDSTPLAKNAKTASRLRDGRSASMTRREFLSNLGIAVAAEVMGFAVAGAINEYGKYRQRLDERTQQEIVAKELFGEIFGAPGKIRSFYEGTHPDNLAAGRVLAPFFGMYDAKPIPVPRDYRLRILPEGDLVLIGGPNSTLLTTIVWEFDGPNDRELDRNVNPILPLRFYGISNVRDLQIPSASVGWQLEGVGVVATVNWPMVDTKRQKVTISELSKKIDVAGKPAYLPYENYLLVTKLPNFLSPLRQGPSSSWPQLLVFQGSNGLGTRAAELLQQPAGLEALEYVRARLRGATSFQVMFRAYDLELSERQFHRFRKIEPLDWAIEPLEIDSETYERAHEYAIERIYPKAHET